MNTQWTNAGIGAVGGYLVGMAVGKFTPLGHMHHLGIGLALVGAIVGYNHTSGSMMPSMPSAVTAPASAPATGA